VNRVRKQIIVDLGKTSKVIDLNGVKFDERVARKDI
jgi:hypothetical protein